MGRLRSAAMVRSRTPRSHPICASRRGNTRSFSCNAICSRSSLHPMGMCPFVSQLSYEGGAASAEKFSLVLRVFHGQIPPRDNSEAFVDGPHVLANMREARRAPNTAEDAGDAADNHRVGRANGMCQRAGEQTSEGRHADEGHRVITHHATA